MNKISKKIVALVTMAAFVLTLVPAAAFADAAAFSKTQSEVKVVTPDGQTEGAVSIKAGDKLTLQFELNNVSGGKYTGSNAVVNFGIGSGQTNADTIQVWAVEKGSTTPTDALEVVGYYNANDVAYTDGQNTATDFTGKVSFYRSGDYTIYAGLGATVEDAAESGNTFKVASVENNTVNVYSDPAAAVETVDFDATIGTEANNTNVTDKEPDAVVTYNTTQLENLPANGIAYETITVTAKDNSGKEVIGADFTVKANKAGVTVDKSSVTTDRDGSFSVKVYFTKAGDYKLYFTNDGNTYTLNLNRAEAAQAENIETTLSNGQTLLAGNDTNYTADCNNENYFADAVQFKITDENGDEMSSSLAGTPYSEPAFNNSASNLYIKVDSKPAGSSLSAGDLKLVWDSTDKVYTLNYADTSNKATDLIPGEYQVTVALKSGDKATANFTLAKFGKATGLTIKLNSAKNGTIGDTIVAGDTVTGQVYNVDESGIEVVANPADYYTSVTGPVKGDVEYLTFTASDDKDDLGSKIVAQAYNIQTNKLATKEVTIVDGKSTNTLSFEGENGAANKNNTVKVSVVDEDGNVATNVSGPMYATVTSQSNEDANIEVTPGTVTNGKGTLTIFSDKETTVDVVVTIVDKVADQNNVIYAGTLSYTIGEEDIAADTSVVMTIGSSDMVVNNNVVAMEDAAPYVANDRTYVPFRALGEALGAEVVWDNDARTVTYTLGKTEVVMTIGEKTYTVNGEEKTMDVAPEITSDRTYVPVRFVGEALGFKVTALSAADGTTASVVFQK